VRALRQGAGRQCLTTAANYPRWDVLSVEMVALNGEPWRLGTRLRVASTATMLLLSTLLVHMLRL